MVIIVVLSVVMVIVIMQSVAAPDKDVKADSVSVVKNCNIK
jgi:hypothetical protein